MTPQTETSELSLWTFHLEKPKLPIMALTYSKMLELGTTAPDFSLPDTTGKIVSLSDFKETQALLVMFICNHCPYVQHVAFTIARLAREYQSKGLGVVAIN